MPGQEAHGIEAAIVHKFSAEQVEQTRLLVGRHPSGADLLAHHVGPAHGVAEHGLAGHIRWHPQVAVRKYSAGQVEFVRRKTGIPEPLGVHLQEHAGAPEHGIVVVDGNLLVTVGLNKLTNLIIGGGANAMSNTNGIVGVGAGTTTPAIGDTALTDDNTANAYYQQDDATFPTQSNGLITAQATFATGVANFAWQEWCLAIGGGGTITAGTHLSVVTSTAPTMVNHATASLGTKTSSQAWVLTATITLS